MEVGGGGRVLWKGEERKRAQDKATSEEETDGVKG